MSIGQQVATSLKQTALFRFVGQMLNWVGTLYIIRLLSPEDYGLLAMAMFPVGLLLIVADLGLLQSIVRSPDLSDEEIAQARGSIQITCGALCLVGLLAAPAVAWAYREPKVTLVLQVLSLFLLIYSFEILPSALMRRQMRFGEISQIEFYASLTSIVASIGLALAGAGVWALVVGIMLPWLIKGIVLLWVAPVPVAPVYSTTALSRHYKFGLTSMGSAICAQFQGSSDTPIVGTLLGTASAGVYAVVKQIAFLPSEKLMPLFNQVMFRAFATIQGEPERVAAQLKRTVRLLLVIAVPINWGVSATATEIIHVVAGAKWADGAPLTGAVSLVMPLWMISSLSSTLVQSLGRADIALRGSLVALAVIPLGMFVGVRYWGMDGVAFVWLVLVPLVLGSNLRRELGQCHVSLTELLEAVWPSLAAGCAMLLAVGVVNQLLGAGVTHWMQLLVLVGVGVLTYLPMICILDRASALELYGLIITRRQEA